MSSESKRAWYCRLALAVLVAAIYGQTLAFDFVAFDDDRYVTNNPYVQAPFSWASARWAFTSTFFFNWHPVTWLSHMADWHLFGAHAGGHHAVNAALHLLNTLLLFEALSRLTGARGRSALVAALFAAHPLHVESVAWISERKDLLSACFAFVALNAYAGYVRRPGVLRYVTVAFAFALSLMSKSMLVTFPCLLLLIDYWPLARRRDGEARWRACFRVVVEKAPLLALSVGAGLVAWTIKTGQTVSFAARAKLSIVAYASYLYKSVFPAHLAAFYPHPGEMMGWVPVAASGVFLLAISVGVIVFRRKRYLSVGWLWYLVALAPASGIVQIGRHAMADRYTYVPLIGVFLMAVWGGADAAASWRVSRRAACAAVAAIVVFAGLSAFQARHWRESVGLFRHALAVAGESAEMRNNLGIALSLRGDVDGARGEYEAALRLDPDYAKAHDNLGGLLAAQGRDTEAESHYRKALQQEPDNPVVRNNFGLSLEAMGRHSEAIACFSAALRLEPAYFNARTNLAAALDAAGRREEAIAAYEQALKIKPDRCDARLALARLLFRLGRLDDAEAQYRLVLDADSGNCDALFNLGVVAEARGRWEEAERRYEEAARACPDDATVIERLNAILSHIE